MTGEQGELLGPGAAGHGFPVLPDWVEDPAQRVDLQMPARPELWRVARMTVSAIGALLSFDVEQIADLRMAVDELLAVCARGAADDAVLSIATCWDETRVLVSCVASPVSVVDHALVDEAEAVLLPPGLNPSELAERILEALADSYSIEEPENGVRRGWLCKTR